MSPKITFKRDFLGWGLTPEVVVFIRFPITSDYDPKMFAMANSLTDRGYYVEIGHSDRVLCITK